jgi:hypothetical protein
MEESELVMTNEEGCEFQENSGVMTYHKNIKHPQTTHRGSYIL